ncbi:hypothetical protein L3V82_01045 [Thiotrichales bacterium 19S3-7]|nr:hypothetical protein [Thiotrichales bacterium 19S3-7]MCF6800747.1 hypothetical protein [Thiotrichales bacterium 19S3-11]
MYEEGKGKQGCSTTSDELYEEFLSTCVIIEADEPKEIQKSALEINAGHIEDLSLVDIMLTNGEVIELICKKTNAIEAIAYLELSLKLRQSDFSNIIPKLYQIQVIDNDNTEDPSIIKADLPIHALNDISISDYQAIIDDLRSLHINYPNRLTFKIYIEQLQSISQANLEQKSLDAKLGHITYSDNEADYNMLEKKSWLNKTQMSLNESSARFSGAANFQISNSSSLFLRLFSYPRSYSTLYNYFNQLNVPNLEKLKHQLQNIALFIFQEDVAAIGSSLFYYGDQVRLIDLAHYMSPKPFSHLTKEAANYHIYHKNLLSAINEQIEILEHIITHKSLNVTPHLIHSAPQLPFRALAEENAHESNPNQGYPAEK